MFKTTRKLFLFPLSERITLLGLRIETGQQPDYKVIKQRLHLKDNWNIQVVYTSSGNNSPQAVPSLLEFPVLWEDEFEWCKDYPSQINVLYKKKPYSTLSSVHADGAQAVLSLALEAVLEIDFSAIAQANDSSAGETVEEPETCRQVSTIPNEETSAAPPAPAGKCVCQKENIEETQQRLRLLEEECRRLLQHTNTLESRIKSLEEKSSHVPVVYSKMTGVVLDALRMLPVTKTIIEIYQKGSEEAYVKLATDGRGIYYYDQFAPGIYDIKIKHPRYLPLVVNDYVIKEGESKYQDFILRRL